GPPPAAGPSGASGPPAAGPPSAGPPSGPPSAELIAAGFALENADAPVLHHGINLADLAHLLDLRSARCGPPPPPPPLLPPRCPASTRRPSSRRVDGRGRAARVRPPTGCCEQDPVEAVPRRGRRFRWRAARRAPPGGGEPDRLPAPAPEGPCPPHRGRRRAGG